MYLAPFWNMASLSYRTRLLSQRSRPSIAKRSGGAGPHYLFQDPRECAPGHFDLAFLVFAAFFAAWIRTIRFLFFASHHLW
jgi:hypothetical protein